MAQAIDLEFNSAEAEKFLQNLSKRKDAVKTRERVWVDSVGVFIFQDVIDHFGKESGPSGKWVKWSSLYKTHMVAMGKGGNKILQDSGRLRQSFTAGKWRKHHAGVEWYNPAKTKDGFPYAYAHDEGGPKLPQRQFMWLSDRALEKIAKMTAEFLAGD